MDKLIITPATSTESVATVEWLAKKIWPECFYDRSDPCKEWLKELINSQLEKTISKQIKNESSYFLVNNIAEEPIGYFAILLKDGELLLEKICLTSENRGRRYGKRIMRFIEWLARKNGCVRVTTLIYNFNSKAIDFFLANKFSVYKIDTKYCKMQKLITNANSLPTREWLRGIKNGQEK